MKKYSAQHNNCEILFANKKRAMDYIAEHPDHEYNEYSEWEYYDPYYRNSTTCYRRLRGVTLIEAIENNFEQIMKSVNLYGCSGYTLRKVSLTYIDNNTAILRIEAWPVSQALVDYSDDMIHPDKVRTRELKIEGVERHDVPHGAYDFELVK